MASRKGKTEYGHIISKALNQDMENRKENLTTAANRESPQEHSNDRVSDEYDQYGDWTRKLLRGATASNKKTLDQGKVSTEPIYCHPQHTDGTRNRGNVV